ncbi:hypothetical protein HFN_1643 [Helicobacter fennelliae MRY12-0050]|uniref:Uncharacterized protein n=1 Tax=Helicobacter fennelliae MRY12-0050 TaxID=1325130 RepID=T1CW50_9HELI|nr:hypothetical protein HFN_1643 [Helicobacter fennelliae MRY12-0050]
MSVLNVSLFLLDVLESKFLIYIESRFCLWIFGLLRPIVLAMTSPPRHCEQGLSLRGNP